MTRMAQSEARAWGDAMAVLSPVAAPSRSCETLSVPGHVHGLWPRTSTSVWTGRVSRCAHADI